MRINITTNVADNSQKVDTDALADALANFIDENGLHFSNVSVTLTAN